MYNANDSVKEMANSGSMSELHQRVRRSHEAAVSHYESLFNSLQTVIDNAQSKEDELIDLINEAFPDLHLWKNHVEGQNVFSMLRANSSVNTIDNIEKLHKYKVSQDDEVLFKEYHTKLHALLQSQKEALEQLIILQDSWNSSVENNHVVGNNIMKLFREKLDRINAIGQSDCESEESLVLRSKVQEAAGSMGAAQAAFNDYQSAHSERTNVFSNLEQTPSVDNKEGFFNALATHLSQEIVVKESRDRYQKEQFARLLAASNHWPLKKGTNSLDQFCVSYSQLIEALVEQSHGFMSPKIQANYDSYDDATVRPINATIFYYFFSGSAQSRWFAQWLLASVRYPNQRMKRAYMRNFA